MYKEQGPETDLIKAFQTINKSAVLEQNPGEKVLIGSKQHVCGDLKKTNNKKNAATLFWKTAKNETKSGFDQNWVVLNI